MTRQEMDLGMTPLDAMMLMSEGNPGALTVMANILKQGGDSFTVFLDMDDMNIRGTQIWVGYKDHCGQDLEKFVKCCRDRDQAMVDTINREGRKGNHPHLAVRHGGSYERKML